MSNSIRDVKEMLITTTGGMQYVVSGVCVQRFTALCHGTRQTHFDIGMIADRVEVVKRGAAQ